jgi:hypothetical protein
MATLMSLPCYRGTLQQSKMALDLRHAEIYRGIEVFHMVDEFDDIRVDEHICLRSQVLSDKELFVG